MNLRIVNTTKLRNNIAGVLDAIDKDHPLCIITRRGKQKYALIDLDELEDLLAAGNSRYIKDIAEARRQVAAGEIFTLEDVFGNV